MTSYTASVELPMSASAKRSEQWMLALEEYSGAVGRSERGLAELVITIDSPTLAIAAAASCDIFQRAVGYGVDLDHLQVLTTDLYDKVVAAIRSADLPELIGVTEAAQTLGVSRQYVSRLVDEGRLRGQLVGKSTALLKSEVERFAGIHDQVLRNRPDRG